MSVLGRGDTHSPGLNLAPDSTRTTAYVLYAIVFQETSVRHTRARTLFVLLPRSRCLSSAVVYPIVRPPSSSSRNSTRESLCTWPLFLEPLAATRGASSELETIPSPPFSLLPFGSILSRPPSFYSLDASSREEKNSLSAANRSYDDRVAALRFATRKIDIRTRILG